VALTEQRFVRSEKLVWERGFGALIQSLGYADALRFLAQVVTGHGDYLAWQERLFEDASVDDLYDQARKHWEEREE